MPIINDPAEIRTLLEADRPWAAYALGDLAPGLFEHCEWHRAACGAPALALVFRAFGTPVLVAVGEPGPMRAVLEEIGDEPEFYLDVRPEILTLIEARYEVPDGRPMWRMLLDPAGLRPAPSRGVVRLSPDDLPALQCLYADGEPAGEAPDFFAPAMLEQGVYFGIYDGEGLAAAAGTHLVVPTEGVGAIGNVYTRRDRRGQGLGLRVTGAVAASLLRMDLPTIVLNVNQHNPAAIRVYERLGFTRYCPYYEGTAVRRQGPLDSKPDAGDDERGRLEQD